MSGAAEAVGLTFTVCTLIVKVFESYEKISDLFGTYRKYSKVVERLNIELSTQKIIFQNECSLLSGAVGVDAKWSMHPDLDKRNNDSCKQLTDLLRLIVETLDLIWEETQRYRREELRDNDSQPNVSKRIIVAEQVLIFIHLSAERIILLQSLGIRCSLQVSIRV